MYWKTGLVIVLAAWQVQAETLIPADYVENVFAKSSQRIVSGWEALPGQLPYHVALRQVNAAGGVSACGGSLVHRSWIISAAHCTALQVTLVVRAGVVALSTPQYIYETTEWYNHPTFNDQNPMLVQPNDIALIKLQRPVTYSRLLQPIRVQSNSEAFRDYGDEIVVASGHGRLWTNGASPEVLNWVYLRAVTNARCLQLFGSTVINDNSICAGPYNVTSQSTCQGDSGGPLVHVSSDGTPVLVGIASFVAGGTHGCHSGIPAGFVRPGPFLAWLEEVSGIDFENIEEDGVTTPEPEVTNPPTTTPEPEVTNPPTTTPEPEVTNPPTTTPEPEVTNPPTTTPEPEVTNTPTTTPEPEVTNPPTTTPEPEVTNPPTTTPEPEVTNPPTTTPEPEVTNPPTTTPEPEVTNPPTTTPEPEVTYPPTTTPEPEVTNTPITTPEPEETNPPTTTPNPPTTTPEPEESTEEPETEEEDESEEDSSESDECDPELSELLKKLQVQVKVNVKLNKYGVKHKYHHNKTKTHHK
ncbi:soluble scavenger receptor cysteine-rich domain-containing protein SSC5D-like [Galleria mellonella]|uniref:Soluble scavenger receptor cysteine-rich domain-containing protein SSC5D-like n=1 Tax=Galleria mellonella TaxID=7137 RepID=A0ABM3N276_GALME|nr:soluble scavenger receptor cysteine-rich domain-containing protein SSC5D-like [Galleria mellonella]